MNKEQPKSKKRKRDQSHRSTKQESRMKHIPIYHITTNGDMYACINKMKPTLPPYCAVMTQQPVEELGEDNIYINSGDPYNPSVYSSTASLSYNNRSASFNTKNGVADGSDQSTNDDLVFVDNDIYTLI